MSLTQALAALKKARAIQTTLMARLNSGRAAEVPVDWMLEDARNEILRAEEHIKDVMGER